jgi:phage tail-like protein
MAVNYPAVGFHFSVSFELPGLADADQRFQEVHGLNQEISTTHLKEGGQNRFSYDLPERSTYQNLVLKRGMVKGSGLHAWMKAAIEDFSILPVNLTVTLLNEEHEPLLAWYIVNAYPVKWQVSGFNAEENSIVIETIELTYQYFNALDI